MFCNMLHPKYLMFLVSEFVCIFCRSNYGGHTTQLCPQNPQKLGFDSSYFFSKSSKSILTKWSWVPVFNPHYYFAPNLHILIPTNKLIPQSPRLAMLILSSQKQVRPPTVKNESILFLRWRYTTADLHIIHSLVGVYERNHFFGSDPSYPSTCLQL